VAEAKRGGRGLRVLGHPLHPALAAFPIAFLSGSVLADAIALLRSDPFWWAVSFWVAAAGVLVAVPTAGAGLVDYTTIRAGDRALRTGTVHLTVMLVAVGCFGIDLLLRGGPAVPRGALVPATVALDAVGAAVLTVGGWYGGELVFRHGVGGMCDSTPSVAQAEPMPDGARQSTYGSRET
jgi:uncharacterized membrane protein